MASSELKISQTIDLDFCCAICGSKLSVLMHQERPDNTINIFPCDKCKRNQTNKNNVDTDRISEKCETSRFTDNNDGTIIDTKTNLIWQKSDDSVKKTFKKAEEYAKSLTLAEKEWRLPTIKELKSIVDHKRLNPSIDPIFVCKSCGYWSGSTYAYGPGTALGVYFDDGIDGWSDKDNSYYVRCVHDSSI